MMGIKDIEQRLAGYSLPSWDGCDCYKCAENRQHQSDLRYLLDEVKRLREAVITAQENNYRYCPACGGKIVDKALSED